MDFYTGFFVGAVFGTLIGITLICILVLHRDGDAMEVDHEEQ